MPSIGFRIALILICLLLTIGCGPEANNGKDGKTNVDSKKSETKPAEPKGPGGEEMK